MGALDYKNGKLYGILNTSGIELTVANDLGQKHYSVAELEMKPLQTMLFFILIRELKYPLNLKVKLFASWLCSAGTTSPHTVRFNSSVHLTGDSHRIHFSSMESSFPLLWLMFTSCYEPLPSFVNWLTSSPQWKVPTLYTVTVFANINHTNRHHFEQPNDKQQMTCPSGQSTQAEFLSNTDAYRLFLKALLGLAWPCHAAPLRECFKCTNWVMFTAAWDTFDELTDMGTSQSTSLCVKICAPSQPLTVNWSFLRSRLRRSSMLETSSNLKRVETSLSPHYATILSSDSDCFRR